MKPVLGKHIESVNVTDIADTFRARRKQWPGFDALSLGEEANYRGQDDRQFHNAPSLAMP